jgi:hypothetical protein
MTYTTKGNILPILERVNNQKAKDRLTPGFMKDNRVKMA